MADCMKCANRNNDYCIFACENGESFKPITNADRIRGMSDEELAGWIYTHRWNDFDGLLDWLKQEVTANDS